MMIKTGFFVLISSSLLLLSGCGDLFGKKVKDDPLESDRLKANCTLDMDKISNIMKEDISPTLDCLGKNLDLFINVSELGKGGKLSRDSLINYLQRNRPDIKESTYPVIRSIFALSHLITGEEADFISKVNVTKILEFAKLFNYHASSNYDFTFNSEAPANLVLHERHRKLIDNSALDLQASLRKIFVTQRTGLDSLKIMELAKSFIKEGDSDTLKKIEGVLFVKKIITDGTPDDLTHVELQFIIDNLPRILGITLDVVRYQYLNLEQDDLLKLLKNDVVSLVNILFSPSRNRDMSEELFTMDQAIEGVDRFIEDEDDKISKYAALIKEVKLILTQKKQVEAAESIALTPDEVVNVTGADLLKIFDHVYNVSDKGLIFHDMYNAPVFAGLLTSTQAISIDPTKFEASFPGQKASLTEFARIVSKYRFQKGSFDSAYYSTEFRRNAAAVVESYMFEYIIRELFRFYTGKSSMDVEQVKLLFKKFEKELIAMDIFLPKKARTTAETITLLGSLFQYQSDNNKLLDINETAEFAVSLMASMDAKKKIFSYLTDVDAQGNSVCKVDQFGRVEPACFKENYFKALCFNYREYYPRLFQYLGAAPGCNQDFNSDKNKEYLEMSILAARSCNVYPDTNQEIEYTESDLMSIVLAQMHIETTIIRWDKNLNNTMDADEVMDAFEIYEPVIETMAAKKGSIAKKFTKAIYQYLVKHEKEPTALQLIGFLVSFNKKAPADRKTIAAILKVVGEQSRADLPADEVFDCNWLHDPENIPVTIP